MRYIPRRASINTDNSVYFDNTVVKLNPGITGKVDKDVIKQQVKDAVDNRRRELEDKKFLNKIEKQFDKVLENPERLQDNEWENEYGYYMKTRVRKDKIYFRIGKKKVKK